MAKGCNGRQTLAAQKQNEQKMNKEQHNSAPDQLDLVAARSLLQVCCSVFLEGVGAFHLLLQNIIKQIICIY